MISSDCSDYYIAKFQHKLVRDIFFFLYKNVLTYREELENEKTDEPP